MALPAWIGPPKSVRTQHGQHVADLPDAEQGGDARQQVLAERRRRAEQVREAGGETRDLRREQGRKRRGVVRRVDEHDLRDAGETRGLRGDLGAVRARAPPPRAPRARDRARSARTSPCAGSSLRAVVLGDDQHCGSRQHPASVERRNELGDILDAHARDARRRRGEVAAR